MIPTLWDKVKPSILQAMQDVDSEYPPGTNFKPGTEVHDRIVEMVNRCAQIGYDATEGLIAEYEKIDKSLDLYMDPSQLDRRRLGRDSRKPVNVVMSQQYANYCMFNTAMHRQFFAGPYLHRFKGSGSPERSAKALIATKCVEYVANQFRHRRALDIHWGDAFNYGRGWMWGKWSKVTAPSFEVTQADELMAMVLQGMGGKYQKGDVIRHLSDETEVTKEGTDWINIDPFQVLGDPTVTPDRFQESEFFGWASRGDALMFIGMEDDPEENLFNCRALIPLSQVNPRSRYYRDTQADRNPRMQSGEDQLKGMENSTNIDLVYMMCRIIPSQWGLGDSKKPQLWMFCVAGDKLLIKAHQIRARHGQYPIVCSAPNARGHQIAPVSHLMTTLGAASATDYIIKRRLDFLDVAHNGKYAMDPTKMEYKDVRDADGPMIVRIKKSAFGTGKIADWFQQLDTQDVTASTWNDVSAITSLQRNLSGIEEVLSGGGLPSDPTATGVDAIQGGALSRLMRVAIILDEQCHRPKAYQDICNISQYLSGEIIIDLMGRDEEVIRNWYHLPEGAEGLAVDKWDIDPEMDIMAMSNVSQGHKSFAAMTEFAKAIMPGFIQQPGAVQAMMPFLSQYMRELGVDDFDWINVTVAPEQMIQEQAQAGNVAPMGMPMPQGAAA